MFFLETWWIQRAPSSERGSKTSPQIKLQNDILPFYHLVKNQPKSEHWFAINVRISFDFSNSPSSQNQTHNWTAATTKTTQNGTAAAAKTTQNGTDAAVKNIQNVIVAAAKTTHNVWLLRLLRFLWFWLFWFVWFGQLRLFRLSGSWFLISSLWFLVSAFWLLVSGFCFLVWGFLIMDFSFWFLASGFIKNAHSDALSTK